MEFAIYKGKGVCPNYKYGKTVGDASESERYKSKAYTYMRAPAARNAETH